jgi:hypothetical protein
MLTPECEDLFQVVAKESLEKSDRSFKTARKKNINVDNYVAPLASILAELGELSGNRWNSLRWVDSLGIYTNDEDERNVGELGKEFLLTMKSDGILSKTSKLTLFSLVKKSVAMLSAGVTTIQDLEEKTRININGSILPGNQFSTTPNGRVGSPYVYKI